MPAARTSQHRSIHLKAPSKNGILNNRERVTKATSTWKATSKDSATTTGRFDCMICEHESSVIVKLEKKAGRGQLDCKVCGQHFEAAGPHLFAAVDVCYEWSDFCDSAVKEEYNQKKHMNEKQQQQPESERQHQAKSRVGWSVCRRAA